MCMGVVVNRLLTRCMIGGQQHPQSQSQQQDPMVQHTTEDPIAQPASINAKIASTISSAYCGLT